MRVVLILVLPFFILIRGASFFHAKYNLGPWFSLGLGAVVTSLLLFFYITFIYQSFTKKIGDTDNLKRRSLFAFTLVALYCIYGLFFISNKNIQNQAIKSEISDLHPILRMGVSTFILVDKNLIITDASRKPEDYKKMGLKTARNSLHYKQKDGYAYAIDLHTSSRNFVRNYLMQFYFRLLGFNTLRHGGTGDHLHISLTCHYKKGGI